ncbi:MAG: C-GCAxxG-C-C family protein [Clostridiales bacterium]|nr:C-GCAxxG-C-C family protein [Clostridiales bacterium]
MTHAEKAEELFQQGYNCAQAVFAAFCDVTGLDEAQALRLASGFGGGVGGMREVCGAVSGLTLVFSALYGYDAPDDRAAKLALYHSVQAAAEQYREANGSIVCRELLGLSKDVKKADPAPRTQEYYKKRPCKQLVGMAAQIADDFIASHPERTDA